MNMPLISIIIAVYNADDTLQQCIDSIVGQTYQQIEIIIIDGASTDRTVEILEKNHKKITYWESKPDNGIYHAWNKALNIAKGDWICFLGADDFFWTHDVLDRLARKLSTAYPPYRVVYGQNFIVKPDRTILEKKGIPWEKAKKRISQEMSLPHPGMMHHRSLFEIHGLFDETFRIAGDYEFLLRELKNNDALFADDIVTVGMRHGGISNQPDDRLLFLKENFLARKKNGIKNIGFFWYACVFRSLVRLALNKLFGKRLSYYVADIYRICVGKSRFWTK